MTPREGAGSASRNSQRTVNLWDLMNQLDLFNFGQLIRNLEHFHTQISDKIQGRTHGGGVPAPPKLLEAMTKLMSEALDYAKAHDFQSAIGAIGSVLIPLQSYDSEADFSTVKMSLRVTLDALAQAAFQRTFLRVVADRGAYVDSDALFGEEVHRAFPLARQDIREAGNCLAADCNTAAVFHMMRAVEYGLRWLAGDLGLMQILQRTKKNGNVYVPVEYAEWDKILTQLGPLVDGKINQLGRGADKQRAQEFYLAALQDIGGIKDAWRNHVMHGRRHYSAKDADAVFDHVQRLLRALAARTGEPVLVELPDAEDSLASTAAVSPGSE